jgi:Cyclic nucleotide-binding domain
VRIDASVFTVSWIPSEAVTGANKVIFERGFAHYDDPPPDHIDDLEVLRAADGFRFANRLAAFIDVRDGKIVDYGYAGGGTMGATTVRLGKKESSFAAVGLPDVQREPEVTATSVKFVQTTGGRTALPAPRRVNKPPFVQFSAPLVWTTLALTLNTDGTSKSELVGASSFPRHWVYDDDGKLTAKAGLADFKDWYRSAFGKHTPWGDEESDVLVTEVETALERELSHVVMRGGAKPEIRKLKAGKTLFEQGEEGDDLFLLLNGVLDVDVDGTVLAQLGPGAILGERAILEGGKRTATLRAATKATVAVAHASQVDRDALQELSLGHRREEQ